MEKMETTNKINSVAEIVKAKAPFGFVPNTGFYNEIKVKRKKWAMLLRGEKEPTLSEFKAICKYFKVETTEYI